MNRKIFFYTISTVFLIIAILHLMRAVGGWEAVIGGVIIPIWFSWVAAILAGYLALRGYSLARVLK